MSRRGAGGVGVFAAGMIAGAVLLTAARELPYLNRSPVVSPVDGEALLIRTDPRGKGYYAASRNGGRSHRGVDVLAPMDAPVYAVRSGLVVEAEDNRGLGKYVKILHDDRRATLYAHMSDLRVRAGQRVPQGARVGSVGKSGNAAHPQILPHLHLEYFEDGKHADPALLGLVFVAPAAQPE